MANIISAFKNASRMSKGKRNSPKEQNSKKEQIEHTRKNVIEKNGIEYDNERREKETENRKEMK